MSFQLVKSNELDGMADKYDFVFDNVKVSNPMWSMGHGMKKHIEQELLHSHTNLKILHLFLKLARTTDLWKTWRPISVFARSLKIITNTLALKVATVLPDIMHESQVARVAGTDINCKWLHVLFLTIVMFDKKLLSYLIDKSFMKDPFKITFASFCFKRLAGGEHLGFNNSVYLSERDHSFR